MELLLLLCCTSGRPTYAAEVEPATGPARNLSPGHTPRQQRALEGVQQEAGVYLDGSADH